MEKILANNEKIVGLGGLHRFHFQMLLRNYHLNLLVTDNLAVAD